MTGQSERTSPLVVDDPLAHPTEGPVLPRLVLGTTLRRLREARGISREGAADVIRASAAKISRLELGRVGVKERDAADLLTFYGVTASDAWTSAMELARRGSCPGWWHGYGALVPSWFETYLGLEQAASLIRSYELQFVPGLLQTADYARAVIGLQHADPAHVERRLELRIRRQDVLANPDGTVLWAVIDESALRRGLGDRDMHRNQLARLIELTERPNVRLQIAPWRTGGHAAAGGSFSLLRFAHPDVPDLVYLEQLTTALYLDKRVDVEHYAAMMDTLCAQVEPPDRTAELLSAIRDEV